MTAGPPARPLRVLHVVHDYFPAIGGSELVFQRIGEGLAARGQQVSVITSTARRTGDFVAASDDRLAASREQINGVDVRRLDFVRLGPRTRFLLTAASSLWTRRRWPGYGRMKSVWVGPHLPGLVRAAVALRPDVIAATAAPFMTLFGAAAAARRLRVPFVVMPCLHPGETWLLDNPSLMALLVGADAVFTLTAYESRLLQAVGADPSRLHVLGGGVAQDAPAAADTQVRQRHGLAPDRPIVLFCGRMEEGKGIRTVVDAMARLWQERRAATLVLAGASTGFAGEPLERLLANLPADWRRHVIVRKDISEAEKWGWYAACDILAHPSRVESFGLVYLEAWLCGKPVIGGRTGPQSALIESGLDGWTVRPGDVEELSSALRTALDDPALARTMGERGRNKVLQRYTWDQVIDRAERLYNEFRTA